MAMKSANVTARIQPDIKEQAEAILAKLGIPVSVFIDMAYRQVIIKEGVPFSLSVSHAPVSRDSLSKIEFDGIMQKGLMQAKNDEALTVDEAFKQLKDCKLIHEKRQGANKPNLIYVGKIDHDEDLIKLIRKNYESRIVKFTTLDTENLRPNYNNNNYNNRGKKNNFQNYEQRQYDNLDFLYANNNF